MRHTRNWTRLENGTMSTWSLSSFSCRRARIDADATAAAIFLDGSTTLPYTAAKARPIEHIHKHGTKKKTVEISYQFYSCHLFFAWIGLALLYWYTSHYCQTGTSARFCFRWISDDMKAYITILLNINRYNLFKNSNLPGNFVLWSVAIRALKQPLLQTFSKVLMLNLLLDRLDVQVNGFNTEAAIQVLLRNTNTDGQETNKKIYENVVDWQHWINRTNNDEGSSTKQSPLTDDKCAFSRGITFHFSILDMGEVEKKNYFRYIKIQHGPQWPLSDVTV